jgi:xanthine dehydrogenase iron-sulfur cluster and FAD-binding subunit A
LPGELLAAIELPPAPARGLYASSYKVSKRQELDISTVSASFWIEVAPQAGPRAPVTIARLAFGGMAATPKRAARAEAQLLGRALDVEALEAAAAALAEDFAPIDDHRGSARYRARVAANLLRGFFLEIHGAPEPRHAHRPAATISLPEPADAAPLRS